MPYVKLFIGAIYTYQYILSGEDRQDSMSVLKMIIPLIKGYNNQSELL